MPEKFSDGTYFKDVPMFSFDEQGNIEEGNIEERNIEEHVTNSEDSE